MGDQDDFVDGGGEWKKISPGDQNMPRGAVPRNVLLLNGLDVRCMWDGSFSSSWQDKGL